MPKVNLAWYQPKVRRIMNDVKCLRQQDIADAICETQQTVSYRIRKVYERELADWIQILDLAGYEIREKEE